MHVRRGRGTTGERSAGNIEPVMLDRVKDTQAGVSRITRQQDYFDARNRRLCAIELQQFLHQWKRDTRREQFILVRHLVSTIRIEPFAFEQGMAFGQIEQRARRNRHDQAIVGIVYSVRSRSVHAGYCRGIGALAQAQLANCSLSIRSSRLCSGSNSKVTVFSRDSRIVTSTTSRTSFESAVALTGRLYGSSISNFTSVPARKIAPRQRRGRNGLIGVIASTSAPSGRIGPCADRLYAVDPADVQTSTPSHMSSSIFTAPFKATRICAACLVWRSSDTSLNASDDDVAPDSPTASITSGLSAVGCARARRSLKPSAWNWFIRNPTVPSFMPNTGLSSARYRCSVRSMNPSPPSATITCACSIGTSA